MENKKRKSSLSFDETEIECFDSSSSISNRSSLCPVTNQVPNVFALSITSLKKFEFFNKTLLTLEMFKISITQIFIHVAS